ncbi:LmeA family phospholipid-binding protein [Nocardia donostiensis]|uniref:DUF2993 domain-containing protein n=1 Tax=Nocardia donostiensis TaxID=1538463 RepID=A0A1W0BP72_9NOCA|nr:DUF2993 domain-containing protein [Nocardia donostiensis]ONM47548.1 hypothetical protein B0T46_16715 [Nocardia donostiensis]OQS15109.1 hypothetical protein B0T36_10590 [Nocardia donostiensis]OQS24282.1 hypothetical protein B0T44_01325 [Nocardia donostiensis]
MPIQPRPAPRVSRRTLVIALVTVVVVLAAVLVGGEAYARHTVASCISSQLEKEMGSKIDVGFGPKPMLLTWIDGELPRMSIDSDGVQFGPAVGMRVQATFHDIQVADGGSKGTEIGSSTAHVTWSNEGIAQTLKGLVSDVSSSESSGVLTMAALGGIAQLQLIPQIRDGQVDVQLTSAELLGIGVPNDLAQAVVDLFTQGFQNYPFGMQPTQLKVTDNGVEVQLRGGPTELPAGNGDTSC